MYVKKLVHNVKGRRIAGLGPRTLIVGPSMSGKTAIVQALELALTGKASKRGEGVLSREVDLLALAPEGAPHLRAEAEFFDPDSGPGSPAIASTVIEGTVAKAKRPVREVPDFLQGVEYDAIFPVTAIEAALNGSPDTLRRLLLKMVSQFVDPEAVIAALPGSAPLEQLQSEPVVDALARLIQASDGQARTLAGEIQGTKDEIDRGVDPGGRSPVVAEPEVKAPPLDPLRQQVADAERALATFDATPSPASHRDARINLAISLRDAAEGLKGVGARKCGICGGSLELGKLDLRIDALTVAVQDFDQRMEAARTKRQRERENLSNAATAARVMLYRAEGVHKAVAALRETRERAADQDRAARISQLRTRLEAAERELRLVKGQAVSYRTAMEMALDTATGALAKILTDAAGFQVGIRLREGDREVCRIGRLSTTGLVQTELSGSEWARLVAALAVIQPSPSPLRIVVLRDRQFDPETLSRVLVALIAGVPQEVQVIVQSVVDPARVPPGWTVVRTGP